VFKEFTEPDRVNLSQGLVSVSTAVTHDSEKIREVYERNAEVIEKYRVSPKDNATIKLFNIFWNSIPCGQIILQIDKESTSKALVSYWVDMQLSNREIATTSLTLIKQYAFAVLHLNSLEAYVQPDNLKSLRVLEKNNFYKTESVFTHQMPDKSRVEHLVYRIENIY
jgi:RimJ/RimL family protein N-acetyltransferase